MGIICPPWYGKDKTYYEKEIKKAEVKLEAKLIEVKELEDEIKVLKEELAKCENEG